MQLIIQMPEKGVSAINFTLTGFDVVGITEVLRDGKESDYNRISDDECKLIVYGGKEVLDNSDKLIITGYQTSREIKLTDVTGASPDAIKVDIYNRYKRVVEN